MGPFSSIVQHHEFLDVSCSHLLWNTEQSVMSKRAQERTTEEEPLAVEKARTACLVSRNLLSAKQTTSIDSGASYGPGNQELGQNNVSGSTGKLARDRSQKPNNAHSSQECEEDDNPFRGTWKPARYLENQLGRTRFEYHSPQVSDSLYIEKVLKTFDKVELFGERKMRDMNTNVLIWGLFMSTTKKASVHLGPNYNENLEVYMNTNFEELKTLFDITQEVDLGPEFRDSECFHD